MERLALLLGLAMPMASHQASLFQPPGQNAGGAHVEQNHTAPIDLGPDKNATLGFGAIFVINLERRPDRLQAAMKSFKSQGLNVEVWNAVDGQKLDRKSAEITAWCDNEKLPRGIIANVMSNRDIWKEMLKRNLPSAVVLADDGRFNPSFTSDYRRYLSQLNNQEWDMLYLHRAVLYKDSDTKLSQNIVRSQQAWGANAYVVSQSGAKKLLDNFSKLHDAIDVQMANMQRDDKDFKVLAVLEDDGNPVARDDGVCTDGVQQCNGHNPSDTWGGPYLLLVQDAADLIPEGDSLE